jgi:SPP1 gp7 family putative phage head morphogenesis protein
MIEGALKADGRLAAKNAVKIRAALRQVTDFKRVFDKYQETQPQPTDNPTQDRVRARSWIMLNVYLNDEPLRQTVMRAWAEAYLLGRAAAEEWTLKAREARKADDLEVNWDNWKPGDKATALLIKPSRGFQAYLQLVNADSYFKNFNKETIVNLGTALSNSIELGLDAESAAIMIGRHVASPSRALTIAITEQNRAMSFGSIQSYKDAELTKMEWAVSDPCDICAKNDGQVITIGQTFASGDAQPPAHPHCRCVLLPVIPGMEDDPTGIDGNITAPTIDGGGQLVNEPIAEYRGYHQAPRRADEFGSPATDIQEMMPDFYARPNIYTTGMDQSDRESVAVLQRIKDKPDQTVTIYRAVPKEVDKINPGDWVTLSPSYADSHLLSNLEEGHVISMKIPAKNLWFDGDSINEFGYDPVD